MLTLTGSALANTTVEVFDGSSLLGTASVNGGGAWSYTTTSLRNGTQSLTAKDVDAAGNVSAASAPLSVTIVTAAKLTKINNNYFVNTTTSDPEVQYAGSPVVAGQFGAWTPIATVQTASGFDIAWNLTGTNEYTVWTTDNNGNYTGNLIGSVSGNSYAFESIEPVFQQDLNGDGVIGVKTTVIQTDGSTSLTEVANQFYLDGSSGLAQRCSMPASPLQLASLAVGRRSAPYKPPPDRRCLEEYRFRPVHRLGHRQQRELCG